MRFIIAAAIATSFHLPAEAEVAVTFPISIPQECVVLAQREGVPTVIASRYQAAKARLKLARLSGKDPLVVECRAAVERAKAQAAARNNNPVQAKRDTTGQSQIHEVTRE